MKMTIRHLLEFLILCPALRRQRRNAWRAALLIRHKPASRGCCEC